MALFEHNMDSPIKAILITVFFGGWALVFNLLCLLYLANLEVHRNVFEVRIRLPRLTSLEVIFVQLWSIILSVRELCAALGGTLNHVYVDIVLASHVVMVVSFFPRRYFQILMVYDPGKKNIHTSLLAKTKHIM